VRSLALVVEALIPERLLGVRRIERARSVRDLAELRALSSDVFAPDSARAMLAQKRGSNASFSALFDRSSNHCRDSSDAAELRPRKRGAGLSLSVVGVGAKDYA
jgi:hypothetical protein